MVLTDFVAGYRLSDANDQTGTYNMSTTGSVSYVAGKVGNAADTNSSGLYRDGTGQNGITYANTWGSWAISTWFKADSTSGNPFIIFMENNNGSGSLRQVYVQLVSGSLNAYFLGTSNVSISGPAISTGTWYHVVLSMNSGTVTLYVNNTSYGTQTPSGQFSTTRTGGWSISGYRFGSSSGQHLDGLSDMCYVWTHNLTTGEVSDLYNIGNGLEDPFVTDTGSGISFFGAGI